MYRGCHQQQFGIERAFSMRNNAKSVTHVSEQSVTYVPGLYSGGRRAGDEGKPREGVRVML